ncbi:MAG: type II secretion system minor pseudopilin GspK [Pseudomonadota bacterium]
MRDRQAHGERREKGAALIVVLLLVATLSFILLSITNVVTSAVKRSAADRARTDFYWRAAAGEQIAKQILEKYLEAPPPKMALGEGIFAKAIEVPIEGGKASIEFRDATLCFNINSLVTAGAQGYDANPATIPSFVNMLTAIGLGEGEARKISDVIVDYIDNDSLSQGQGAEDGFYSALPTPFRTGSQLLSSISELRALDGMSRGRFSRISPYLCAHPTTAPGKVNINMASDAHAPILLALQPAGSTASLTDIKAALGALPPGGLSNVSALTPPLAGITEYVVTSDRVEAKITLEVNDRTIEEKLLFDISTPPVRLLARTFGDDY